MELLAPAGSWDAFIAGIENGADAVYLGGKSFSARQSAPNFSEEEIKAAVEYAHIREKKVYVTANTLLSNDEFGSALDYIFNLYQYGVDAVIVQDLGLMDAIKNILPAMRVHASTQMTVHNSEGAEFLLNQGIKRVVLAREMSLQELEIIHQEVPALELEVFVHGALCYSYSGQCLFSSMVGGRSGNRGRCAQPCRLSYDLYSRKSGAELTADNKGRYILSPSDLSLLDYLPELQQAGITSLKIEGRMKRPEYVAVVTSAYRQALDLLERDNNYKPPRELKDNLLKIFNRNFSAGYLIPDNIGFLSSTRPNNRGVNIGRVVEQSKDCTTKIRLSGDLNLGDGLEIWVSKGRNPAFIVKKMKINEKSVSSAGKGDIVSIKLDDRVLPNDRVFKTHDEKLIANAMASIQKSDSFKIAVDAEVYLKYGEPLKLIFIDEKGNKVQACSGTVCQKAQNRALDENTLREKIDRLGNTPFYLRKLSVYCDEKLMIPFSEINETRRKAGERLKELLLKPIYPLVENEEYHKSKTIYLKLQSKKLKIDRFPKLSVVVSGTEEAYAAVKSGAERVYIALEGVKKHRRVKTSDLNDIISWAKENNSQVIPALPRIQKPGDFDYESLTEADEILAANLGVLNWSLGQGIKTRVDYSINIFNQYSLEYLLRLGVTGVCLSPELSFKQLDSFTGLDKAEIIIHGEMVLMVSQYCNLPDLLGGSRKKCAGYCRQDSYYIKDEKGYEFPVETDTYCRYYVFNSRTLCMIDDLQRIMALQPESIRIEARRLDEEQVGKTVKIYRKALEELKSRKNPDLTSYKEELARISNSDFTKCHYYRGVL